VYDQDIDSMPSGMRVSQNAALVPRLSRRRLGVALCSVLATAQPLECLRFSSHRCQQTRLVSRAAGAGQVAYASLPSQLLKRVAACNDGAELARQKGRPLLIEEENVGVVLPQAAEQFARFPEVFDVSDRAVAVIAGKTVKERSAAVAAVLDQLREEGHIAMLKGWRGEAWGCQRSFHEPARLVVERAAGPLFGISGFGCHINGLVAEKPGGPPTHLWVAKRASTKPTYPGALDHIVAGGLTHGEKPGENVIRECAEEASIPAELAEKARAASFVSYCQVDETGWGIKRDMLFCYDLLLPMSFEPVPADGEVEGFKLWKLEEVLASLASDDSSTQRWKPNVALVILDMAVRWGLVTPDEDKYVDLVRGLRQ